MTGQAPDLAGPHEEEQVESDFLGDGNVADESEDHRAQVFRVCACPLASNKVADVWVAMQTIVGQVNSEFQGDVTRMTLWELSADFTETPRGRSAEERSDNGQEPKGFKVTSFAGGDPSNNSRAEMCWYSEANGEIDASRQWPSKLHRALETFSIACSILPQVFRAAREGVVATTGCESVLKNKGSSK